MWTHTETPIHPSIHQSATLTIKQQQQQQHQQEGETDLELLEDLVLPLAREGVAGEVHRQEQVAHRRVRARLPWGFLFFNIEYLRQSGGHAYGIIRVCLGRDVSI